MQQTAERRAVAERTYTAKAFAASGAKSGLAPAPVYATRPAAGRCANRNSLLRSVPFRFASGAQ